ncbi:MAG: ATP-binding cassette domain-containing protein, partial [Rhodobacteraceae bacterium]|nr:ATP-binding cassette domain-containing protein [Paracoccaceae bacterium]
MIKIDNLDVWYGAGARETHVVQGASLHVERGQSFGLVGESGSGKSTILRAISGLVPRWGGAMSIDGIDARDGHRGPQRPKYLRKVQMVFQDPFASLHPKRLVGEAISE